jgi:chaperonin GroEL
MEGGKCKSCQATPVQKKVPGPGLGFAQQVVIDSGSTTVVGGGGGPEELEERIRFLRNAAEDPSMNDYNRERISKRASQLEKGVALIKIGGKTHMEKKDRKLRTDDALGATRAALEGGTVVGGGVALINAATEHHVCDLTPDKKDAMGPDEYLGHLVVIKACSAPAQQIAHNAGENGEFVSRKIQEVSDPNYGFNAQTRLFGSLVEQGIIDPTNVVTSALVFAGSSGSMLLTVGCAIAEAEEEDPE